MGRRITKSQKAKKRAKIKQNKIKKMEREDSKGVSRKSIQYTMNPKVFIILKIISLVSIPLVYFLYSPLLIITIIFSISLYGFAIMTERKINHTFIKANHIKILKFDSIVAVLVVIIAIFSLVMSFNTKRKMPNDFIWLNIEKTLKDLGSCYTGSRRPSMPMNFSAVQPPAGLPSMDFSKIPKKMDFSDLPVEALFSIITSSIQTVLVFLIPVCNLLTLIFYYFKKKRFNKVMNEVIDTSIPDISDLEFERIFLFGYELKENEI